MVHTWWSLTSTQEGHPVEGTQNKVWNEVPRGQPSTGGWTSFTYG